MVARIKTSGKFTDVLLYNEKKVAQNKAFIIHSNGFLNDTDHLSHSEKSDRFQRLHELNTRAQVNTLHISLNFEPGENLSDQKMTSIADRYMEGLQLQNQPYLVYRHEDSGHPHMHIVSSLIQPDGSRIRDRNIGRALSEPTRKTIEREYQLIPASRTKQHKQTNGPLQKIGYYSGTASRESVQQILEMIGRDYKFSSLPEYNAVLRQYNIYADTGSEKSQLRQKGGLVYRMLDDQGHKVGPPLKASSFPEKPTLKNLEKKFKQNTSTQLEDHHFIRQKVDWALAQSPASLYELAEQLRTDRLEIAVQKESKNQYTLTYVDNEFKTAISDRHLGKAYTAGSIQKEIAGTSLGQQQAEAQRAGFSFKAPQFLSAITRPDPDAGFHHQIRHKL